MPTHDKNSGFSQISGQLGDLRLNICTINPMAIGETFSKWDAFLDAIPCVKEMKAPN